MTIRYCPHCAHDGFAPVNEKRWECPACGFCYYQNVAAATVAILRVGDEILICERANAPHKGMFDLPGGFLDNDESAEAGLARELHEELGLVLDASQLHYLFSYPNVYPYEGIVYRSGDSYFEVRFEHKPLLRAEDDVASVRWVRLDEIAYDRIAFESLKAALRRYCQMHGVAT